jgi:hypothetical protein
MDLSHLQSWINGFVYGIISSLLGFILLLSIKNKKKIKEKKLKIDNVINNDIPKFDSSISPERDLEILYDALESLPQLRSNAVDDEVSDKTIMQSKKKKLSSIKEKLLKFDSLDIINSMKHCEGSIIDENVDIFLDINIKSKLSELEKIFLEHAGDCKDFEKNCKHVLSVLFEIGKVIKNQGIEFKKAFITNLNYKDDVNVINNVIKKKDSITSNNNHQKHKFDQWIEELMQYIDNCGQDGEACGETLIAGT